MSFLIAIAGIYFAWYCVTEELKKVGGIKND